MPQMFNAIMFVLVFAGLVLGVFPVTAQISPVTNNECGTLGIFCTGSDNTQSAVQYARKIINVGLALAGILASIFIILGGVRYIMSQGEEDEAKQGKRTVLFAIIGLLVIGLAAAIVNFIVLKALR